MIYKLVTLFISVILFISCSEEKNNLAIGDTAPDFILEDANGDSYTLSSYRGKNPVVIFFYPKANTSGCTTQACGVRDDYSKFVDNGIKIFGISVDDKESINEFITDHNLNFPLLSDNKKTVAKNYGVLNASGMASRVSFIIDKNGNIANIINDVDVKSHSEDVLKLALKLI